MTTIMEGAMKPLVVAFMVLLAMMGVAFSSTNARTLPSPPPPPKSNIDLLSQQESSAFKFMPSSGRRSPPPPSPKSDSDLLSHQEP
ncbi:hypothetical protein DKX38_024096 [Salix brachista]|uniref:Uncharacterized protein n=1 Tax=Salix brachista TaxID=2182728 RepID=A0A5N5JY54_9ROSI|nr:hypothetical protein DKX38_024096 [Salix brachista]